MKHIVAETILEQLGGNKFIVMTGASHLVESENSLRMHLPKNMSKANRLEITLTPMDTYTMRFYRYSAPRLNHSKMTFTNEKVTEVAKFDDVYCDMLQEIFTQVTGMYIRLF